MSDQEQKLIETTATTVSSENPSSVTSNDEKAKGKENESNTIEQYPTRRSTMSQDIRYSTEPSDREKLMEKYNNYQISDINACNIRFLTDNRQKKSLFGRNEEENSNLHSLAKTFNVNIFSGYQHTTKHSYKIFGTEVNVRKCLIEIMNRMFKQSNRSTKPDHNKKPTTITTTEKSQETETINPDSSVTPKIEETEVPTENEKSPPHPTAIFVTTINPDSSITEEQKHITPATPNTNEENTEQEQLKPVPPERKPKYTFIMLISSQGQEVLKKNWSFFGGSLQQRLNVVVTNPVKLQKFGDKQIQNELAITGELIENLTDASLQIASFINDVLGVAIQPYKYEEQQQQSSPNENNHNYRSSQHQGRTFFNRNRSGIFEQIILIRTNCVSRIIGTRGSNLKRIQTKCHLRDMIVSRQGNENGYTECTLTSYQIRNINFAIDTIRSFLRNEDDNAVIVLESNQNETLPVQDSPHLHELVPPKTSKGTFELSQTNFLTKNLNHYPQPSYNFQNTPSFDFTHQATSASRKTDKRRGDLHEQNKTPTESPSSSSNQYYENFSSNYSSNSPKHKSKRSCPETKEIDCTTDDGFWIQKQYYYALDDSSKQLFDSLIEKLDKIRIANEENAARKQQRLVGRNRLNKSKIHTSSISSYLTEDTNNNNDNNNNRNEKELTIEPITKLDPLTDINEEKENKQDPSTVVVSQN